MKKSAYTMSKLSMLVFELKGGPFSAILRLPVPTDLPMTRSCEWLELTWKLSRFWSELPC